MDGTQGRHLAADVRYHPWRSGWVRDRRPAGVLSYKRLFGPDWLQVEVGGVRLRFPSNFHFEANLPHFDRRRTIGVAQTPEKAGAVHGQEIAKEPTRLQPPR
jgi:hypothetical protein